MVDWYPGKLLRESLEHRMDQGSQVQKLPLGFSIEKNEKLTEPYYFHNEVESREAITREAVFAFPLAYTGFLVGGIKGVVGDT